MIKIFIFNYDNDSKQQERFTKLKQFLDESEIQYNIVNINETIDHEHIRNEIIDYFDHDEVFFPVVKFNNSYMYDIDKIFEFIQKKMSDQTHENDSNNIEYQDDEFSRIITKLQKRVESIDTNHEHLGFFNRVFNALSSLVYHTVNSTDFDKDYDDIYDKHSISFNIFIHSITKRKGKLVLDRHYLVINDVLFRSITKIPYVNIYSITKSNNSPSMKIMYREEGKSDSLMVEIETDSYEISANLTTAIKDIKRYVHKSNETITVIIKR